LYVKNVIKKANKRKTPLIFLKLDIAKAFDSLNWGFLLKVLERMCFGQRWRDLISLILASTSSRILLNGRLGKTFSHKRGLRQGDPLSPMLFILAMEPLQRLLDTATEQMILSPLQPTTARFRASFYADDAALFVNPNKDDIVAIQQILLLFGNASGLRTNIDKCVAYSVACEDTNLNLILQGFGGALGTLPCRYLGLPLGFRKPRRVEVQPLVDRALGRLKGWKGKLMSHKWRLILINSVITATATYFLTIFKPNPWLTKKLNTMRRSFLWALEDEQVSGGRCLVSWKTVCAPLRFGGLGIKDLEAYSRALRLRWEWFRWTEQERPWVGTDTPCDEADKDLFAACMTILIGNGETARFWSDRWLSSKLVTEEVGWGDCNTLKTKSSSASS
jgi:hypothetical protein